MEIFIHVTLGLIFGFLLGRFAASFLRKKVRAAGRDFFEKREKEQSKKAPGSPLPDFDTQIEAQRTAIDGQDPLDAYFASSVNMAETHAEAAARQQREQEMFGDPEAVERQRVRDETAAASAADVALKSRYYKED
jgi:hypothetical protein